jgi:hypothetical protein
VNSRERVGLYFICVEDLGQFLNFNQLVIHVVSFSL